MSEAQKVKVIARSPVDMFRGRVLEGVTTGFYFASAVAWMDVVRAVLTKSVKVKNNSQNFFALTAIITTIISVIVSLIVVKIDASVKTGGPMYAVTRGRAGFQRAGAKPLTAAQIKARAKRSAGNK
jgi:hypothetical protein